ncbi:MAG: HAD family hydrolase [Steroidobacteraceae bacterium]
MNSIVQTASPIAAEAVALYTFDVFDTLLTRIWLRPTDVFLHAELLNAEAGSAAGIERWSARRIAAEARVRQKARDGEVTLEQIYAELAAELGWSAAVAGSALETEMRCELQASRPIAPMVARFESLLKRRIKVACVSDFYASGGFLLELLTRAGVRVEAQDLFVSADIQETKRTGALFHSVTRHYNLQPAEICHTGDHPVSDVQQAKRVGIAVEPYVRSAPSANEVALASWGTSAGTRGREAGADTRARLLASAIGGAARRARIDRELQGRDEFLWSVATGIAGPLLFGYVYWILIQARDLGIRRLYFLARDGQILLQIARQICSHLSLELDLKYLHASRRAWFLPSVARGTSMERVNAILSDDTICIAELLQSLEINPADVRMSLQGAGLPEEIWNRQIEAEKLKDVLSKPPFDALILERATRGLDLCMEYLENQGMLDGVPNAIVDIGWKGRLQTALVRMLRGARAAGPISGFYMGLRERPDETAIGRTFVYVEGADASTLNPTLIELFTSADHGSTLGYERLQDARAQAGRAGASQQDADCRGTGTGKRTQHGAAGQIRPILAPGQHATLDWGLGTLQEGINAFSANMLDSLAVLEEPATKVIAGLRKSALLTLERLIHQPSPEEAALLGAFPHAAGQFHHDLSELAPRLPIPSLLRGLLSPKALDGRTHWAQASMARSAFAPRPLTRLWDLRVTGGPRLRKWFRGLSQRRPRTQV